MNKTVLITGASDGIGLLSARMLLAEGHRVLLHGRNPAKLAQLGRELSTYGPQCGLLCAELSQRDQVMRLADQLITQYGTLDVLINNAGVLESPQPVTADGLDVRFAVNTLAPYALTRALLAHLPADGRVVNVASAAQAPVEWAGLRGEMRYADAMQAYAQSKLALIQWGCHLARQQPSGPLIVAVNPGSLLASKMVKEGFGIVGRDLSIGAEIVCQAAVSADFSKAQGRYFDNDSGQFSPLHPDAQDPECCEQLCQCLDQCWSL